MERDREGGRGEGAVEKMTRKLFIYNINFTEENGKNHKVFQFIVFS